MWTEFVRRFQPLIAGIVTKWVLRRGTLNRSLIDDLVQDTYLKICANNFKALRDFDFRHENALFGFLKVVSANVVEDHFRGSFSQKRGSGREEEDLEQAMASSRNPESSYSVEREILMREIAHCLEEHASEPNFARDYAIFWLYYRQGLTAKAIAEIPTIRLSLKGVESTLLRLTRLVRAKLAASPAKGRRGER